MLMSDTVFGSLLGGKGVVLSQFIQCSTDLCTVGSQLLMVEFLGSEISQEMNSGVYSSVSTSVMERLLAGNN